MTSRRRPVVAIVLVSVGLLAACTGADEERRVASVGALVDGVVAVEGRTSVIQLPDHELRLTVGLPLAELPATGVDLDTAPEGGSLVPVAWDVDLAGAARLPTLPDAPAPEVSVSLVADGEAYPLDELLLRDPDRVAAGDPVFELSGSTAVAVSSPSPELAVRVEWDGLVQEARRGDDVLEAGVAERLYSAPERLSRSMVACTPPQVSSGGGYRAEEPRCALDVQRTPWVGGLGWAEEGRGWLVVTGSTGLVGFSRDAGSRRVFYAPDEFDLGRLTIDGEPPVEEVPARTGSSAFWAVFEVADDAVEHTLRRTDVVSTTGGDEEVGEDPGVTTRWRTEVPFA